MGTSLVAQSVKNLPAMQETQVWSLGREDSLEKEKAERKTGENSSFLAWRIPWASEAGNLQSIVLQGVRQDRAASTFTFRVVRYNMKTIVNTAICYIRKSLREEILRVLITRRKILSKTGRKKTCDAVSSLPKENKQDWPNSLST